MFLVLKRRHSGSCIQGYPEDSFTSEPEERKKGHKRCDCPIIMSGTLAKKPGRRSTRETDWDKARVKARELEEKGTWDAKPTPTPLPTPSNDPSRKLIVEATAAWKNKKLNPALNPSTAYLRKIPLLMDRLEEFSRGKGYIWIDQWKLEDVEAFRFSWPHGKQSTSINQMTMLKEFFRYCEDHDWVSRSPAQKYKETKKELPSEDEEENEDKKPFTEDQVTEMLGACILYGGPRYAWEGKDVQEYMEINLATGLRISDMIRLEAKHLQPSGHVKIRTRKNRKVVNVWVEPRIQEMILERAQKHGARIFGTFASTDIDTLADNWRRKLKKVWALCGPWAEDDKPHPHRFRHTFARRILESGRYTTSDLAALLGDSEKIVIKYYSQMVQSRHDVLTKKMTEEHAERQRSKMVAISEARIS